MDNEETSNTRKQGASIPPVFSSSSSSGISQRIQNQMKTASKERTTGSPTNSSSSGDILKRASKAPSFDMSNSAAMVANALEISRNENEATPSFKSNSFSNLRKKSPPNRGIQKELNGDIISPLVNGVYDGRYKYTTFFK